jgi:hypothetical protein
VNGEAHIERMYRGYPAVLEGVVDQIRTASINLVAEVTAHMPEGVDTPSPEVATNAVNFLVTRERHKISFSAPQAGTALTATQPEEHPQPWLRTAAAILIGIATIVERSSDSWKHKAGFSNARRPSRIRYRSSHEDR